MSKAAGDGGDISLLVAKHVKQMELTENKWKADLEATRKKQKRAYRCCIRRWASQGLPDKLKADILGEFKIALKKTESSSPSKRLTSKQSQSSPGKEGMTRKKGWWGSKRNSPPVTKQAKAGSESPQALTEASPARSFKLSMPSTEENKWEHFTVLLGRCKALHNFGLGTGDVTQFCRLRPSDNGASVRAQTIRNLYSNSLNAIVLVVDQGLTYTSKINKEFVRCCRASPEAYFCDFEKQLKQAKAEMGRPIQPGDVFITQHSNLEAVHIAFHLVGDSEPINSFTADSPQVLGLHSILSIAHDYDVENILFFFINNGTKSP